MKPVLTLLGGLLLALTLNSCVTCEGEADSLQPCQAGPLPFTSLQAEYGCTSEPQPTQRLTESYSVLIRSQAEFDRQADGACHPQVDFGKYDLVLGRSAGSSMNQYSYDYQQECPSARRRLRVLVQPGITNDVVFKTYHVLVPKLALTEEVSVEVVQLTR